MNNPSSILITGATSGIGGALAEAYAGPGITLALTGRHESRLSAIAGRCRERGAQVLTKSLDVTEAGPLADWINQVDSQAPPDLVIANAGISGGTDGGESAGQARCIFAVNLDGVLNTVLPVIPLMQARGRGQIAVMSSLAGFRGFPGAPAYCASKAAVKNWGESLRGSLAGQGIEVSVICPGFVRTPMTDVNPFPMPLIMDAGRAAAIIRHGLTRNHGRIVFPWPLYALVWIFSALPLVLTDPLFARLPAKSRLSEKI